MFHRGYMYGAGGGLLMFGLFLVVAVGIALLVLLVLGPRRAAVTAHSQPTPFAPPPSQYATGPVGWPAPATSPARAILDERLAKGEITVEEYQRLRAALDAPGT